MKEISTSKRCTVTGYFVVEQPRQSNWDLWILNWIQIELRPSRRNRRVRTGFRRSGEGGRPDLWPCVEAEIAETVPDRRQESAQPAQISDFSYLMFTDGTSSLKCCFWGKIQHASNHWFVWKKSTLQNLSLIFEQRYKASRQAKDLFCLQQNDT